MSSNRVGLSLLLLVAGFLCLAQAQVPMTGAGKGSPGASTVGIVQVDQSASVQILSASGTSTTFPNQTVTGGLTNSALVVVLTQATTTNVSGMTVTWDSGGTNQSMTQVATFASVNGQVWMFAVLSPIPGNKTLAVSWTGTGQIFVDSISLKNVLPASVAAAFLHASANNGNSALPTVTTTSQANNLVVNVWQSIGSFNGTVSGTEIHHSNGGPNWTYSSSYDAGSASVVATSATTGAAQWNAAGIDVVHD